MRSVVWSGGEGAVRVFVLALDALDYRLVTEWGLKYLLQRKHGSFKVGREYYDPSPEVDAPYSPIIWTSVITGRKPEEHGIKTWWTYGGLLEKIRYLPVVRHIKGKRKILRKLGIKPRVPDRRDLKFPTIFDVVKPSVAVNVPGYNYPTKYHEMLSVAAYKGIKEYVKAIRRVHNLMLSDTLRALNENRGWKLFFTYFHISDLLGHVYGNNRIKLFRVYSELNVLAGSLQQMADDCVFLIMSDHGMNKGEHTDYTFWSLNIDDGWEPHDFTEFFPKILEWVGNEEG